MLTYYFHPATLDSVNDITPQSEAMRAPEVWRGVGCFHSSDVWSFAVTLPDWIKPGIFGLRDMPPDFVIPDTFEAAGIDLWEGICCVAKLMLLFPGQLGPQVKDDAETQLWFQITEMLLKTGKDPYEKSQPYKKHRPLEEQLKTLESRLS